MNREIDRRDGNFPGDTTRSTTIEIRAKTTGPTTLWWKMLVVRCARMRTASVNGGHASTVVPPRCSLIAFDTQHGRYPRDISAAAYCHLQPPKIPLSSIVRVANVHRPTTAAAVPVVASAIRPRPAIGRCGIDWPSCPSSERGTHTPTSVPFFVPSFSYFPLFLFFTS